ncbi:MAG: methyltransferase domain-containing protein, partial [Planctomycetota bacterium]
TARRFLVHAYRSWTTPSDNRECPVCGWKGQRFLMFGTPPNRRLDATCPKCGSLERQRLGWRALERVLDETGLAKERLKTLHVAPEVCIEGVLRERSSEYLSIDLTDRGMRRMDVTDLQLEDGSFDLVWCSHVLEHVPDDGKALAEFFRVLRPGGVALLQVPVWGEATDEDASVSDPMERLRRFHQRDHVRAPGDDYGDRMEEAGFDVDVVRTRDFAPAEVSRQGLDYYCTNEVFVCRKPVAVAGGLFGAVEMKRAA